MSRNVGAEGAWGEWWTTLGCGECWTTLGCGEWVAEVLTVDSGIRTSASAFGRFFRFLKHTTQQTTPIRTVTITIMITITAEEPEPEDKEQISEWKKRLGNL